MSRTGRLSSVFSRWPTILAVTVLGILVASFALSLATPHYVAQADVLISPAEKQSTSAPAERTVASFAEVLGGRTAASGVVKDLGLGRSIRSVDRDLSASVVDGTTVLRLSATSTSADESARIGQAAARSFLAWLDTQDTTLSASIVSNAVPPAGPSQASHGLWRVLGALIGLVAGIGIAAARQRADHSIRTPAELEEIAGAPSISDGALLVVRHGQTGREAVDSAVTRIHAVGGRLLGTVLTMAPVKELSRTGYGYGYGYGPEYFSRTTGSPRTRGGSRRG